MNNNFFRSSVILYCLLFFCAFLYYTLAYETIRSNFTQVFGLYAAFFAVYFIIYKFFSEKNFKVSLAAGIVFRFILLFSVPNLSDDVFRFIWDGRMAANGLNPFRHLPSEVMHMSALPGLTKELYSRLNSPDYYTIYPPLLQVIFLAAAKLFVFNLYNTIIFFKCVILLVECSTLYVMILLLKKISLPRHFSLLYFLNPLIIVELTGNVHFDGLMIFFVLLSFLLLLQNFWKLSAISLAFGIAAKFIPALFIPLLIYKTGWRKGLKYLIITSLTCVALFALVFDLAAVQHIGKSMGLFFHRFEFNASVYYIIRWLGNLLAGYNIIAYAGPVLAVSSAFIIMILSFYTKRNGVNRFFTRAMFISIVLFFFSTTVHPWYISLPVSLAVFTSYRFPVLWSFTSILSYAAYQSQPPRENVLLIALGYLCVAAFFIWELKKRSQVRLRQEQV